MSLIGWLITGGVLLIGAFGIRIVNPRYKMLVETLGKYTRTSEQGFRWVIPIIQFTRHVNITERMVDIEPQVVITKDKLNTEVDAIVRYQIADVKKSQYNVDDHERQLTALARTTLRAVIGKMTLTDANENRDKINTDVEKILNKETSAYGVQILNVELQRIEPPKDVQVAMNQVVKAEQAKISAKDLATATETEADGERRATIKVAEGKAKSITLQADAKAIAIKVVNNATEKTFKKRAQLLRKLEAVEKSLQHNAKIVLNDNESLVNVIGDLAGSPIPMPKKRK